MEEGATEREDETQAKVLSSTTDGRRRRRRGGGGRKSKVVLGETSKSTPNEIREGRRSRGGEALRGREDSRETEADRWRNGGRKGRKDELNKKFDLRRSPFPSFLPFYSRFSEEAFSVEKVSTSRSPQLLCEENQEKAPKNARLQFLLSVFILLSLSMTAVLSSLLPSFAQTRALKAFFAALETSSAFEIEPRTLLNSF